jgi:signal transduction histidine kinase
VRSLYLRIYLTVVAALALFALVSGFVVQRHIEQDRLRRDGELQERLAAWGELLQRSLPGSDAPAQEQAEALQDWSLRLRLPMALDDAKGRRIGAAEAWQRRGGDGPMAAHRAQPIQLEDGRTLWVMRPGLRPERPPMAGGPPEDGRPREMPPPPMWHGALAPPDGLGLAALLVVLFGAVAAGAWPVVRRLTRRLEALKLGVEAFGAGALDQRVAEDGRDEVAALGASFNRAATRIEALLRSHQSLLANASHELRSPLARLKMAVAMLDDAPGAQRAALRDEIHTNIGELDALVEEVLLASRLDASTPLELGDRVDLLGLATEEALRTGAAAAGDAVAVEGNERLLRRALRNLLENAGRYGGGEVTVEVEALPQGGALVSVRDRGPGVPGPYRERIFEPFFRLPGHAEREGGIGLGLALVRQIAERHGGSVRCLPREGGGTCFSLALPARR